MAKKSKRAKRRQTETIAEPLPAEARRDPLFAALAAVGVVLTLVLLWSTSSSNDLPYCSHGSGCDLVQASNWSRFLGLPLALWGFGLYALMLVLALGMPRLARRRFWLGLAATSGAVTSVYLTAISVLVIEALCTYCLISLALLLVMSVLAVLGRVTEQAWRPQVVGTLVALIVAGLMHADANGVLRAGGVVDPDLRRLAEHLEARGDVFYGASWCPHCQQQKDMFGAAAEFLPYVECAPHGPRGPRATACQIAEIRNYPTWMIDGRKVERLMPPELLAKLTGFEWDGGPP